MPEITAHCLLETGTVTAHNVLCKGNCRPKGPREYSWATHLVFPYRGVFLRHCGGQEVVAESSQLLFFNNDEEYCVSHPVAGGDDCLALTLGEEWLREVTPKDQLRKGARACFQAQRRAVQPGTRLGTAMLLGLLAGGVAETLELESLAIALSRRALAEETPTAPRITGARQKLVNRAKLALAADLARRWSLADVAREVGVSPVYLTQLFHQVEGIPLYRYQLRLRLAHALNLMGEFDDLAQLGVHLGFSSHSHFSFAFRRAFGLSPAAFRRHGRTH